MTRCTAMIATMAACLAGTLSQPTSAQDYPTRPIRAIAASAAGGISDVFMRTIGEDLHKRLGQPIIVENRPGGAFNIGARACAEAPPDGYTICIMPNEPVTYNHFLFKTLSFDPARSFEPITNLFFITQVLAANAALGVKTLDELAALSKSKPGTLSYSSPALAQALFVEKFNQDKGADLVRVPFRGGGEAVAGMLTGTTPVVFIGVGNLLSHLRAGTAVGLVVDGETRSPLFPEIPTVMEVGYRDDMTRSYFGLFAPAGAPRPVIDRVRGEISRIMGDEAFREKHLVQRGLEPVLNSPEDFAEFLKHDRARAERIVKASGLQPQ
jgi:tripartite-type tricarboxylate transporter receptor subunit TctC